jgi:hypothetical protein
MWQYVHRPSIPDLRQSGCGPGNGQARQSSKAALSTRGGSPRVPSGKNLFKSRAWRRFGCAAIM